MEEVTVQIDTMTSDDTSTVVLDIESLTQTSDRSAGSPKMTRALSRKWSYRAERLATTEEEDTDEPSKKLLVKVNPQFEPVKQPLTTGKSTVPLTATTCGPNLIDVADGRNKRFNRLMTINPKKILFIFATLLTKEYHPFLHQKLRKGFSVLRLRINQP